VLDCHVQSLLGSRNLADARLRALERVRLIRQGPRFHGQPRCYQITRAGLDLAGSSLPQPRTDLREYKHDVGVAWLWLGARRGAFGPIREVVSERALRSGDMTADGRKRPLGVRLGGVGPKGRESLHYPDLLLVDPGGRRTAVELELTPKEFDLLAFLVREAGTVVRRERIMREVWDQNWFGSTKTLDMHISWLRRKIGDDAAAPRILTTVRGVGFRFEMSCADG